MREHSQALVRDGESEGGGERRSWCGSLRMRSAPSLPYFPGKHGTDWCLCHPLLHADVNYSGGAAELLHSCRWMTSPPAPRSQPASQPVEHEPQCWVGETHLSKALLKTSPPLHSFLPIFSFTSSSSFSSSVFCFCLLFISPPEISIHNFSVVFLLPFYLFFCFSCSSPPFYFFLLSIFPPSSSINSFMYYLT